MNINLYEFTSAAGQLLKDANLHEEFKYVETSVRHERFKEVEGKAVRMEQRTMFTIISFHQKTNDALAAASSTITGALASFKEEIFQYQVKRATVKD